MKKVFLMAIVACVLAGCGKLTVDNTPVVEIDLARYLGSWYEIARYDHSFERGMQQTRAEYSLREDGHIRVVNSGIKNGEAKESTAIAKTTETPALLRVSFFRPFYGDYRVLMLDEDYQYALIGGGTDDYLWILSRTPQLDEETKALILAEAQRRGYDVEKLIWVEQKSPQR